MMANRIGLSFKTLSQAAVDVAAPPPPLPANQLKSSSFVFNMVLCLLICIVYENIVLARRFGVVVVESPEMFQLFFVCLGCVVGIRRSERYFQATVC
jgi:hypothetical protein